jgi:hypothetical protein
MPGDLVAECTEQTVPMNDMLRMSGVCRRPSECTHSTLLNGRIRQRTSSGGSESGAYSGPGLTVDR